MSKKDAEDQRKILKGIIIIIFMVELLLLIFGVTLLGYNVMKHHQMTMMTEEEINSDSTDISETGKNMIDLLKGEIIILEDTVSKLNREKILLSEENYTLKQEIFEFEKQNLFKHTLLSS